MKFRYFLVVFSLMIFFLYYLYRYNIAEVYSYLGYTFYFNYDKIFYSFLCFIIFIFLLRGIYRNDEFTFTLVTVFFIFSTLPYLIFYSFTNAYFLPLFGHFLFLFFNFYFSGKTKTIPKLIITKNQRELFLISIILIGIIIFFSTYKLDFKIGSNIVDVYTQRKAYNLGGNILTGYLYSSYANIICPFIIYYGLETKKRIYTIIGFSFAIYLGLISGLKSTFLNLGFILIFYLFKGSVKTKIFGFISSILFILVIISFLVANSSTLAVNLVSDLLVRRTMFTNPLITNGFFVLFENESMYWKHSIFKSISGYNGIHPNFLVGNFLFGAETETNANTGLIADGYSNFGIIGFAFFTFILSYIIYYLKCLRVDKRYIGIYIIMIMGTIEMELTVMFFTHGLLLLILLSSTIYKRD